MGRAQAIGSANALVCAGGRHANIADDHVRSLSLNRREQRIEVAARGDKLHIFLGFQQAAHAFPDQEIVFGEHHANRHGDSIRCIMAGGRPKPVGGRAPSRVAWSLWAVAVSLAALQLLVMATRGLPQESERLGDAGGILLRVLYVLTVVLLSTMGALIASRHRRNVIGWLCCAWGLIFAAEVL